METVSKQTDAFTQDSPFILQGQRKIERTIPPSLSFYLSHALSLSPLNAKKTKKKTHIHKLSSAWFFFLLNFSRLFLTVL